jgi:hypothetical protein
MWCGAQARNDRYGLEGSIDILAAGHPVVFAVCGGGAVALTPPPPNELSEDALRRVWWASILYGGPVRVYLVDSRVVVTYAASAEDVRKCSDALLLK